MDRRRVREASWAKAREFGYATNAGLPLLESRHQLRDISTVLGRFLSLHAATAVAYGLNPEQARSWILAEALNQWVSPAEDQLLNGGAATLEHRAKVEALWTLAWALRLVDGFDFQRPCPDDFVHVVPDLNHGESAAGLRSRAALRSLDEMVAALDLAYCLDWAVRDAELRGLGTPEQVPAHVIRERRRALEWLLGRIEWDKIELDT